MNKAAKIFVTGHRGMVGSAIVRRRQAGGYTNILTRTHAELDLLDQRAVHATLAHERPDYIFIAAAKVGGIQANNQYRADFLYQNLLIEANLIHGAHLAGVQRLMFLGSSCIYPRDCRHPTKEEYLLTGPLEPTNEPYAIAKIAGIKLAESYNRQHGRQYVSVMPTNLYGSNDNYALASSHVLPVLIREAHEAKLRDDAQYIVSGRGTPRCDFLHVDDLADACVQLIGRGYDGPLVNIGTGEDATIRELPETVMPVVGFEGRIVFDASNPDGTPRKLLDVGGLATPGGSASGSSHRPEATIGQRSLSGVERPTKTNHTRHLKLRAATEQVAAWARIVASTGPLCPTNGLAGRHRAQRREPPPVPAHTSHRAWAPPKPRECQTPRPHLGAHHVSSRPRRSLPSLVVRRTAACGCGRPASSRTCLSDSSTHGVDRPR
jgi:GDP-L-fucose synthase